ncbi:calmodulin-regulated spectrin-associated protein 1-B-like [Sinocyclocheilus rhinocerous]|uniref:calmodulin-regulated spectrin-associated protein 1-B-like n=1 Tax=Sinocyclocheilus rhinocerous TaxID=307959 RepID=UPI0007B8751B|nr:PREDICTED: calmodulin-regulated spectrin-associated protein 1-B-like [Sinocyclocheilus rhinocerous]
MDVGALAGGDDVPRRADSVEGGLEIVPLEMYDSARAKIEANLRWLFAKAYGEGKCISFLQSPSYKQFLSSELYCRVCGLLLKGDQASALTSHQAVIQTLARRGICVREADDTPVSYDDLSSTPIKMSSHIPLIDALMMAYTVEMMAVERVVVSVKRFSTFCASKELPFDMEDAMLFWINKVILKTRELSEKELKMKQPLMDSPCHQKSPSKWYWKLVPVRYRREHLSCWPFPHLAVMEDLMKDVCDGAALLAVVHFYCPEYMRLDDICLKEVPSLSDSVYNIHLLREFSNEYLNRCFYLHTEDLLYSPPVLKHNVMVFIAELFWWFEVVKPDFVKPRDLQEIKDVRASLQPKSSRPHVPISNATKRSLLTPSPSADSLATAATPDGCMRYYLHPEESLSVFRTNRSPSHPLLPLRQRPQKPTQREENSELRNRSNSLSRMDGLMLGSQFAWTERKQRPISQMEMDWERVCGDNISLARSISKDSLASNVVVITPRHRINGQPLPQTRHYDNQEEEEELLAVINPEGASASRDARPESFFLEPLQPAVLRPNKEKTEVSKWEESGEGRSQGRRGAYTPTECTLNRTFTPIGSIEQANSRAQSPGSFFLHDDAVCVRDSPLDDAECVRDSPLGGWEDIASDSEFEEDDEMEVQEQEISKAVLMHAGRKCMGLGEEEESAKLREDVCLRERYDKEAASGRASPCPSMLSQASSTSTGTGRLTSFAERRRHRVGFPDGCCSTGSSQTTTPDGSESVQFPSDASPGTLGGRPGLASELVHLRMQLEEKRRAIEMQKKKMENLSARQRLQLGKAAFLHVVKRGRSDTLPHPLKTVIGCKKKALAKDDSCVEILKAQGKDAESKETPVEEDKDNRLSVTGGGGASDDVGGEPDLGECSRSIELLNEAIGAIQQQMMQLSLQQDLLMKQTIQCPQETKPSTVPPLNEHPPEQPETKSRLSVQFTETLSTVTKRPPRLSSSRTPRTKPSDLKLSKDANSRPAAKASTPTPGGRTPLAESEEEGGAKEGGHGSKGIIRNTTFRQQDAANRRADSLDSPQNKLPLLEPSPVDPTQERSESGGSGKENVPIPSEENRTKAQLIEVDLSDLAEPTETSTEPDEEQKSGLGFFFKDDQKAEDELAKKRAAFLLKQQRKAEEARIRKQQLEAESELKRDEARRKAEEERVRKEEEKARRELIKQEYLRRKQQELLEEQGVTKPRPRNRRPRPKSLHRAESSCSAPVSLCSAPSGSSLSLASAATEGDSVASGGASSHRMIRKQRMSWLRRGLRSSSNSSVRPKRHEYVSSRWRRGQSSNEMKPGINHGRSSVPLRKAEEERVRKEEEKARRELIKQEYLSRKQQELLEEQGVTKPRPRNRRPRPKSLHRAESSCSAQHHSSSLQRLVFVLLPPDRLSHWPLLLLKVTVWRQEGPVHTGEWEQTISHCCLAGKVNEAQKNAILEEIERCESNHLIILFRDGGCQFRALYVYSPETEEIVKLKGTGPRAISRKMIDRLYKYSSDRKQFTVIPAKSVSVSVDALTIHGHLWQAKRPSTSKRK